MARIIFINGLAEGIFKEYYTNGQLMEIGSYMNDKHVGKFTAYYETGQLKMEVHCDE